MLLKGKTVLLTGAGGGIGAAVSRALAGQGARLILVSRSESKLDQVLQSLDGAGHRVIAADVSSSQGRNIVVEACADGVDVVINNAAVNYFGLFETQSEQQIKAMFEVNALAPMLLIQALLPVLCARESVVVNVGSGFGSIGFAGYCGYSASKFALRGFTEALRRELADSSVSVCYLGPRATDTGMNPAEVVALNAELGNAVDAPEKVAAELLALLAKPTGSRFIGWPERFFVKLNSIFPQLVDKALGKQLLVIRRHAVAGSIKGG